MDKKLDILFISEGSLWPLDQGYRIRGYHMSDQLERMGLRCGVASMIPPPSDAPQRLLDKTIGWPTATAQDMKRFLDGWSGLAKPLRVKLAHHQALDAKSLAGVIPLIDRYRPSAVIGLGQHAPLMLRGVAPENGLIRAWYAADEPIRFHLSCLRSDPPGAMPMRLRKAMVYAGLEALFTRGLDAGIGVNRTDTKLLTRLAGVRQGTTIHNGVDLHYFHPSRTDPPRVPGKSLIFWGRLDFEPNIDAVCWFAKRIWPALKRRNPDATWKIIGKNPNPRVQALTSASGIELVGAVDDIRPHAHAAAAVVLPMRRGGGIKNKLLEAAAMAKPIVATPRTLDGLAIDPHQQPALICHRPEQWVTTIERVWANRIWAARKGRRARVWVKTHHSWSRAAKRLVDWLGHLRGRPFRVAAPALIRRQDPAAAVYPTRNVRPTVIETPLKEAA